MNKVYSIAEMLQVLKMEKKTKKKVEKIIKAKEVVIKSLEMNLNVTSDYIKYGDDNNIIIIVKKSVKMIDKLLKIIQIAEIAEIEFNNVKKTVMYARKSIT